MKKIISTLVAGCILASGISALAGDINITIDGEEFIPKNVLGEVVEPFIENGSTYLPVRAMGEAVGKEVAFDSENYAVYIGTRPMESDIKRMPYAQIGDTIYYEDEIGYIGQIEAMKEAEAIIILTKSTIEESVIEEAYNEQLSMYQGLMEVDEAIERYIYVNVCVQLLMENATVEETDYADYVTVKHILVTDENVAKEIIEKLNSGTEIEELIEEFNIDPGQTKDSSYTFSYGEMVEEFEKASFELKEGEYTTEPVATSYGYHIIKKLPLDKESIEVGNIKVAKIIKELEKVELNKVVEVKKSGDYGSINSVAIPVEALENMRAFTGTGDEKENFEVLAYMIQAKEAYELNKDLFTDEDLVLALDEVEELKSYYGIEGNFFNVSDRGKAKYLEDVLLKFCMVITKLTYEGETSEAAMKISEAMENEIETVIFKQIRVFVDGKLIVPCDVNYGYVEPKNIDGTVYVPVRAIVEALGMKADWDNDTRTVVVTK